MKVEFLNDGVPDCPLIRLYSFTQNEVVNLQHALNKLANEKLDQFAMHKQTGSESIDHCELNLLTGIRNQGVQKTGTRTFDCILTPLA
jgi:hypothetical protein